MSSICGASCEKCTYNEGCKGCTETCGSPFGGRCVAAEYIKVGGREAYARLKNGLKNEINALLRSLDIPETDALYELPGSFVNPEYVLPSGGTAKFLNDKNVYLGAQIELADTGTCCGVAADTDFILVCGYSVNGSDPELIAYKKR